MRRTALGLAILIVCLGTSVFAYQPSATSPYTFNGTYSCSNCEVFDHYRVGDGNWHAPGCGQSGAPLYYCDCSIGFQSGEMLQPPILRVNGNNIELEYFARNAYCNPPADGGNVNEPNAIPYFIQVYAINPQTFTSTVVHVVPPYWEHGKISFTGSPSCTLYRAAYFDMDIFGNIYVVSSNVVGGTGSSSGLPCLADTNSCPIPGGSGSAAPGYPTDGVSPSFGHPINVGSGNMQYSERLFSVSEPGGSLDFTITYNSRDTTVGPLGRGFIHPFAQTFTSPTGGTRLWRNATGGRLLLAHETHPVTGGDIYRVVYPSDTVGAATFNGSTYTFRDLAGTQTMLQNTASGTYTPGTITDRWGNQYTTVYTGSNLTRITDPLGRFWTLAYSGSRLTSITDGDGNQWRFTYDGTTNQLMAIFDPLHTGSTPWRQFTWVTYASGQPTVLAAVADDSGAVLEGHQYDSSGRATSSWTGDTTGSSLPAPGTNARELATITYTDDTHRTVTSSVETGVTESTVYTITAGSGRFLATSIQGTCVSCGTGVEAQTFTYDDYNRPLTRVVGIDRSGSGGTDERVTSTYTYDANGQVLTATEAVGTAVERTTSYAYAYAPWPSFVTSMTRASVAKPGQNAVTTLAWNTSGTPETTLTTTRSGYLAATDPSPTAYVTIDHFDARHRLVETDGPGTNEKSVQTFYTDTDTNLDRRGRLQESRVFTDATASLATTFDDYTIYGAARKDTDANGVDTVRITDAKGRVTSTTSVKPTSDFDEPPDYVTTFTFDSRDRLTATTLPRGNSTRYRYEDGSNRLLETIRADSAGLEYERLLATLNTAGYKSTESAQECPTPANPCLSWTTRQSESFSYDAHGRLATITHPDSTTMVFTYDSRGNAASVKDERHSAANGLYAYDARNRLQTVTQKQTLTSGSDVVTQFAYDDHDDVTSVTDPNGNVTSYAFDDFERVQSQVSPVSGTSSYTYDAGDNLVSTTDANGATTTRTFDAFRRVLTASSTCSGFDSEQVTWTYDDATAGRYGKGRTASMTDPSGSTDYFYERRGLLRSESRMIGSWSSSTDYAYDADGNRTKLGKFEYTYDFAGRQLSVARRDCPTCSAVPLVSSASYLPFGPEKALVFANGTTQSKSYDARYQISENKLVAGLVTLLDHGYASDAAGNIASIHDLADSTYNRDFGYDDLNRLTSATSGTSLWGTGAYSYDAMGNMLASQLGDRTESFTYNGTTPLIATTSEQGNTDIVEYDAVGNELDSVHYPPPGVLVTYPRNSIARLYSCRNLVAAVSTAKSHPPCGEPPCRPPFPPPTLTEYDYTYDGRDVRVSVVASDTFQETDYVYTPELRLSQRRNATTGDSDEFAWFNSHPVAQISSWSSAPLYTFTDHLGTPVILTDSAASVVWQVEYEPYGRVYQLRAGSAYEDQPLRFEGQDVAPHSDQGTEESYNVFRWYEPAWGRYAQSDPIGLSGGINPFAYVDDDPEDFVDPLGLRSCGPGKTAFIKKMCGVAKAAATSACQCQVSLVNAGYETTWGDPKADSTKDNNWQGIHVTAKYKGKSRPVRQPGRDDPDARVPINNSPAESWAQYCARCAEQKLSFQNYPQYVRDMVKKLGMAKPTTQDARIKNMLATINNCKKELDDCCSK